ncbi:hypothetical protein [Microvirga sp. CF3016]|uniref:hypothetical protein n=1 Tax=Microvirga sp. CF3016 TaxID=3110181 RepID=UPI002E75A7C6|nr:hypothetical protein [Microvirga sp. CF3016]MEE1609875.1 hypothetical protein [Microvirga sp. CF3016]
MTVDPTSRTSRYSAMRQRLHRAEWIHQAVALVSALALLFHIGAMAAGAGPLPDVVTGSAQALDHAHHTAAEHAPDVPEGRAEHVPPCCILSVCPGLPAPPTDHTLMVRPRPEATVLVYRRVVPTSAPSLARFSPVRARAPPVPV